MKILVISHEFPPIGGGGANACLFLAKGYAERGHKVTVVTVWYEGLQEHEIWNGVEIYRVRSKRKYKEHCSFKEMASYLLKALPFTDKLERKNSYDMCQVFFGIPSGPIGYWLKKRYKLPYIIRFGGGDIPGFQERFSALYKVIGPFLKIIWKNAEALIANSEGLRKFASDFYDRSPIEVIHNGVDADKYFPNSRKRDENLINLVFVSRLIERKGLQFLIPQLRDISARIEKNLQLTIVGDGPYREKLEQDVKKYQVENIVKFIGQKNKDELPVYYQTGDIFVFPSKREGMPNAVLEAMACGLPIIMTHCEGSDELVTTNGVVTDSEKFADNIVQLANDDNIRKKYGEESRRIIEEQFGWNKIVEQYLNVLEGVKHR